MGGPGAGSAFLLLRVEKEEVNPKLHILTTCFRVENLDTIAQHIVPGTKYFDLCWHIAFDGARVPKESLATIPALTLPFVKYTWRDKWPMEGVKLDSRFKRGWVACFAATNSALWDIDSGWVWINDDDNIVHPDFFHSFRGLVEECPKCKGWIFSSRATDGSGRAPAQQSRLAPSTLPNTCWIAA